MDTYKIESYSHTSGAHYVLQEGDRFQQDGENSIAMLIRRVDTNPQAILLTKTPTGTWAGTYKEVDGDAVVTLSFDGEKNEVSRSHPGPRDNDTGTFTATQQPA